MSLGELVALARRHIVAVAIVLVVAMGVAYSFKHTPPTYGENATIVLSPPNPVLSPPYVNPYAPAFGTSLIITGEVVMKWMAGAQGQQLLRQAGIVNAFNVTLINFSDQEYPLYSEPNLTASATAEDPTAAHSALEAGIRIFEEGLVDQEVRANVPPSERIATHVIADSGPVLQLGSNKRTYAGLAMLTIIGVYMTASFIDRRPSLVRRIRRFRAIGLCHMRRSNLMLSDGGDLVLVGSGGFGRETAEAVRALVASGVPWRLLGFIDDDPNRAGKVIDGTPVLGGREELERLADARVVVCTGRPSNYVSRLGIVDDLGFSPERYATIIHPSAVVSSSCSVGPGSVLLACTVLTAAVRVGAHVAVMPHVTLTHDDEVGDFATLASRAALGGAVRIGHCAYIGAAATVGEQRTVGEFALIGMGAVVTKDVPAREVWAGVPARHLRAAEIPGPNADPSRYSQHQSAAGPGL